MACDVLDALSASAMLDSITLLGNAAELEPLVSKYACSVISDIAGLGLTGNLDQAAQTLQKDGKESILIVHSDLPLLTSHDIDDLLRAHKAPLTLCPASRDGGTNALIATPPTLLPFCFGQDSFARHVEAAQAANLDYQIAEPSAFAHDIDTPADLDWLCQQGATGHTGHYLAESGILQTMADKSAPGT